MGIKFTPHLRQEELRKAEIARKRILAKNLVKDARLLLVEASEYDKKGVKTLLDPRPLAKMTPDKDKLLEMNTTFFDPDAFHKGKPAVVPDKVDEKDKKVKLPEREVGTGNLQIHTLLELALFKLSSRRQLHHQSGGVSFQGSTKVGSPGDAAIPSHDANGKPIPGRKPYAEETSSGDIQVNDDTYLDALLEHMGRVISRQSVVNRLRDISRAI